MNIFIYSDESGVFDREHNKYFVFGGLIFISKKDRDICIRKYSHVEKIIRRTENLSDKVEVKATTVSNDSKGKLFRSLNSCFRFGMVINQNAVNQLIFSDKKTKQRYLDFAYKIAVKRFFQHLIKSGTICARSVEHLSFFMDEHTTATNGRYELKEGLENEFKRGTFNWNYNYFYPPIFPDLKSVELSFCDSSSKTLIRAADIIANRVYYLANTDKISSDTLNSIFITRLP